MTVADAGPAAGDQAPWRSSDLGSVARCGSLNFVGAAINGLLQFLLVVALARLLTRAESGAFFEAVALFLILSNTAELGADTGLTRMIPSYRVHGRIDDIRASLRVSLVPSFAAGAGLAVAVVILAQPLAELFTNGHSVDAGRVATYIRVLAVFLPLSCAYTVAVAGTRGFGTMRPNVFVDRIGRAVVQNGATVAAAGLGGSAAAIAIAWGLPIALALVVVLVWLMRLVAGVESSYRGERAAPTDGRKLAREFWTFTAPRGLTGVFQVTILWVGTLMVGSLMSTSAASVYTASTRYLVAGSVVNMAVIQAIGPKLAELLSAGNTDRAREVYRVSTSWLMLTAWPLYMTLAIYAPLLLHVFGHRYATAAGASSLIVLSLAMLVATGIGPVDMVLLMGGRSFWNLFNVVVALILNVALSLLLVPRIGITGAAVAWAASIVFNNVAPLVEVRAFLKLHPFGRGFPVAAIGSGICFGAVGLAVRQVAGLSLPALVASVAVSCGLYALLSWRFREALELDVLRATVGSRRR
ncbi:MAG TPA: polysaccharide biosynthesis C-terminal domain-containing protein [Gaiellales bacterium]|nr:polysaccharide biosynthesis C-terminal domain-containing protein [Gaiellales bacterium]